MACLEIEIERSQSGVDWFRVVLYNPTVMGWTTRVFGEAWNRPRAWMKADYVDELEAPTTAT
jgi:hypothetical protein